MRLAALIAVTAAVAVPSTASASELIDRNASKVTLQVQKNGQALLSYNARGKRWNVLAWGAVNALAPTTTRKQVAFRLDYSGGYGTYKRDVWKTFKNACAPYDGPELQWLVTACKAPDGSYWAVQAWQRMLSNYGEKLTPKSTVWELRLSHWKGPVAELTVNLNWAYKKYHHIFGSDECARLLAGGGFEVHGIQRYRVGGAWGLMTLEAALAAGARAPQR